MRSLIALLLILSACLSQPAKGASPGLADLLTNAKRAMTPREWRRRKRGSIRLSHRSAVPRICAALH